MRKVLSFLLIFMLIFSLTTVVFADDADDTTENTVNDDSDDSNEENEDEDEEDEDEEDEDEDEDKTDGELLYDLGIIYGSGAGQLNEDQPITRAELIAVVIRLLDPTVENEEFMPPEEATFEDVPVTHWAYRDIELAVANQLTTGIGNDMFGADNLVTYNEALLFLLRSLGYDTTDIQFTSASAIIATEYGLYLEDEMDGTEILERGEFFELLAKTLDSDIFGVQVKKLYRLSYDEDKMEAFLNGRGHTKDYKTGEVRDLRILDNYLGQLRRFMERLDDIDADDVDDLLESIDLEAITTKEETRTFMNQIQQLFVVHQVNDNGNKPDNANDPFDSDDDMYDFNVIETDLDSENSESMAGDDEDLLADIEMFFSDVENMAAFKSMYLDNNQYNTIAYPSFIRVLEKLDLGFTSVSIMEDNGSYSSMKYNMSYSFMKKDDYDLTVSNDMGFSVVHGEVYEVRKYSMVDGFSVYAIMLEEEHNDEKIKKYIAFTMKDNMVYEIIGDSVYGMGYKKVN